MFVCVCRLGLKLKAIFVVHATHCSVLRSRRVYAQCVLVFGTDSLQSYYLELHVIQSSEN
jgi:hypothetical protein